MNACRIRLTALLAATLAPVLAGDRLLLEDGSHLSGTLRGITESGSVLFEHPAAAQPVRLRGDQVAQVAFEHAGSAPVQHDTRLLLVNGDTLPCELGSIDDSSIRVETSYAGEFEIPRGSVSSAQLGLSPLRTLYSGPDDLSGWKVDEGWHYADGALVSTTRGAIHREVEDFPESFSISFQLEWRRTPNLQVYFCSPTESIGGSTDRYYLQFNSAGFELKRQSSEGRSYRTLGSIDRRPDEFSRRSVEVEIRFDHRRREVLLFLDRVLQKKYRDPVGSAPGGDILMFYSSSGEEGTHRIRRIAVRSWDVDQQYFQNEERGRDGEDSLIDREGQRFSGNLIGTEVIEGEPSVLFKSPHFPDPLPIPIRRISTLFFPAEPADPADPAGGGDSTPLAVGIGGIGSLSARSYSIDGERIRIDHPLLGEISLERSAVSTLERRDPAAADGDGEEIENPAEEGAE